MASRAVVSVGNNPNRDFRPYGKRLRESLRKPGNFKEMILIHYDEWPPGSPSHEEVQYGFKVHAMKEAFGLGYETVLWLNVSCHAVASVAPIFEHIENEGYFVMESLDSLGEWSSDRFLETFGLTRDEAMPMKLACGAILGLSRYSKEAIKFMTLWERYATAEHFNGTYRSTSGVFEPPMKREMVSKDSRCRGHRSDEPYWTAFALECGMKMSSCWSFLDNSEKPKAEAPLRSGYDLP